MSLLAIVRSDDRKSLPLQPSGQHIPVHFIVFHQQNFRHYQFPRISNLKFSSKQKAPAPRTLCNRYRRLTICFCCRPFRATVPFFRRDITRGGERCLGVRDIGGASSSVLFYKNRKT